MAGVQLFVALIENLPIIIMEIAKAVPQIIAGIVKAFGSLMYKIVEIGGNIVKGLWSGIQQLASWLWDKVFLLPAARTTGIPATSKAFSPTKSTRVMRCCRSPSL